MPKKAGAAKRSAKSGSVRTTSLFKRTNKGEGPEAEERGEGGELHQTAAKEDSTLTTQQGIPVADDQNTLRVGARGPALLEDLHFREKISTSITSASLSVSCMRADTVPMVSSS